MVPNFIVDLVYGVELNLPTLTTGTLYNFSAQNQFNAFDGGLSITGIETFTESQLAISPTGKTLVSAAGCLNIMCTLQTGPQQKIQNVPYLDFNAATNNGFIKQTKPFVIAWEKSGVLLNATTGISANESVYFNFYASKTA